MPIFNEKLEALEDILRDIHGDMVVAGDFNARAQEWGMPETNTRGRLILEMAYRLGLSVLNEGNTPTYRRPGFGNSIPDVSLASDRLAARITGWKVIGDYTGSDHDYISFVLWDQRRLMRSKSSQPIRWNTNKMDPNEMTEALKSTIKEIRYGPHEPQNREDVEALVTSTLEAIQKACRATMPRKREWKGKCQAPWWTEHIAELRRKCLRMRRRAQRCRNRVEAEDLSLTSKKAKKDLRKAIRDSKNRCWRALCEEVNQDPWGKGYKIVTKKLGVLSSSGMMDASVLKNIVDTLFPTHLARENIVYPVNPNVALDFTREELDSAVGTMKNKKAPGPDGIPAEIFKMVSNIDPGSLLKMYNACLKVGVFPAPWKIARLVLISKGKGNPHSPSSYRPLCMLDTAGKLLERLLKPRLLKALRDAGDLAIRQHGFRKGHSTLNAVEEVVGAFERAQEFSHQARPVVLLVTLDVKNAFNSARWVDMLNALERDFKVPGYLLNMISDYLKERHLIYDTEEGLKKKCISAGAAQGSILGPDLWNVTYDRLLRLEMPDDTFLIGYADDVAAIITARDPGLAQLKLNQIMRKVNRWMSEHGLQLALAKTEIVMLTRKRVPTIIPMTVGLEPVRTSEVAKYLGITFDTKLSFWPHIRQACEKAAIVTSYLSRIMANIGGPRSYIRRLLMSTVNSILLYGAEIWAEKLRVKKYRKRMASVQRRGALRIACSYRTVSEAAIMVVAGVIPIDLLAKERRAIFLRSRELGRKEAVTQARCDILTEWQQRWNSSSVGRWTLLLIPRIAPWADRRHGEVNFYVTQFLTGHGYFRAYLHRRGRVGSPMCTYCERERDTVEHTFFACARFKEERERLFNTVGTFTPEHAVQRMLGSDENWSAVARYVEVVLRMKKEEGCLSR